MLKISKCLYCRKGSSFYWKGGTLKVWNCKEQGVTCSFISYLCGYCAFGALSPLGFSLGFDPLLSSVLSLVYELFTGSPTVYATNLLSLLRLSYLVNTLTLVILESQVTGLPNPAHLLVERQNADPCHWSDFHTVISEIPGAGVLWGHWRWRPVSGALDSLAKQVCFGRCADWGLL